MAEILLSIAVLSFIVAGILICIAIGASDSPMRQIREFDRERQAN